MFMQQWILKTAYNLCVFMQQFILKIAYVSLCLGLLIIRMM